MTMNDTWGYKSYDNHWKSAETIVRNLVDIASKGGNYLLNVGPTSEGLIPDASVERLKQVGQWMKVNNEAIYATTASPFKRLPWGRCTRKTADNAVTLYFHVFDWPSDGRLLVPGLKNKAQKAYLLADAKRNALTTESSPDGLVVTVLRAAPDPISTTVVLKVNSPLAIDQPIPMQASDGSINLLASEARFHGDQIRYESGHQRDNIGFWTDPADWADWEFTVTKPGNFEVIAEVAAPEAASLEISIGDQKLKAEATVTGDYAKFKTVKLGRLEIKSTGKTTLALHALQEGWHPLNVKSIQLKP
jgi:Alpha-L-fucosidase